MNVLISYSHIDGEGHATKLHDSLKKQRVGVYIDKYSLIPGQPWLKEFDRAIRDVDYVLGIMTPNYLESTGGLEAYAAINESLKETKSKFIPLFFILPKETDSPFIKALHGFIFFERFDKALLELMKFLKEHKLYDSGELLSKIESKESPNPFRRVRAEYFFEDYELLASAFAEPEKEKYDMICGERPIIIFGGRGSGKSMILKSLTPEVLISRHNLRSLRNLKDRGINFYGIYFRLKRGSLLINDDHLIVEMGFIKTGLEKNYELYKELILKLKNQNFEPEPILTAGINAAWSLSLNEMNLKILNTTIKQLVKLKDKNIIQIDRELELKLTEKFCEELDISKNKRISDFNELIKYLNKEIRKIIKYLQNLAFPYSTPEVNWVITGADFLDEIYEICTNLIKDLTNFRIFLLFDEFENLCSYQQKIINEWVKTSKNFTVKIASKFNGMYTNMTSQGQALQDGQDYFSWSLDYNLLDKKDKKIKTQYQELLVKICRNLLLIENYKEKDIRSYLGDHQVLELPQDVIDNEIREIRKNASLDFDVNKMKNYRDKLQEAVIFRLLRKREKVEGRLSRKKKYYSFESFTYLSSGIIRFFLNLVGMSFYKAEAEGVNLKEGEKITAEQQTWAAYVVSKAWLEKIPSNLEEHGEKMYQFIIDLSDIFRERLLYHSSEPETLTFCVSDPYLLKTNSLLDEIFMHSVKESIFHVRNPSSSMGTKAIGKTKPKEYVLNRIYCPILEISYRNRWPRVCEFTTNELNNLLNYKKREVAKNKLRKEQHKKLKQRKLMY